MLVFILTDITLLHCLHSSCSLLSYLFVSFVVGFIVRSLKVALSQLPKNNWMALEMMKS